MRARLFLAVLILVSLPAFAAITGTVINPDGQAIAGVKVSSFALESVEARRTRVLSADITRKPLATTQSDSKGNFSIDAPKASVVDLRFEASGFAPQNERAAADDDAGVIQMMPAQMKQGTITANGKPVANATVMVAGDYGEIVSTTDATGHYSLPDPARVNSRVIVRHADYALTQQPLGRFSVTKTDVALEAGAPMSGRVVAEDGQTGVANATVFVDHYAVAKSGEDGTFTIAHLQKKWEEIEVRIDNRLASRANAKDLKAPLQFRLARGASLSGTVRDAKTQLPLAGAEVRLVTPRTIVSTGDVSAISDAKGSYAITGINGADYDVMTSRPNYGAVNVSVHIASGQNVQKALYGTPLGRISGTVVDEDKKGITAAHIESRQVSNDQAMMMGRMRFNDRQRPTLSAPDGHFLVRIDTESDVQLEAAKKGLPSARSSTLKVAAGERKSGVVITLPRGVAVTGRVLDSKGKPIAGVAVGASEARPSGGPSNVRRMIINNIMRGNDEDVVKTSNDGTFSMRVKEGTYDVGFKHDGFAGKTLRAQQIGASSKPLEVTLEPGVEVSGRVTRGGAPVEGVNVIPIGGDSMLPVQTAPDGTFHITDLAPGELMVAFSKREEFIQVNRAVSAPANDVNVDLPPGGRISGRVVDKSSHSPVKAFEAGITPQRNGGGMMMVMPASMRSFTSDDGTFVLENVPVGGLTLSVNAPGYVQARVPNLTLESGKALENVEVSMETGVRVTGHITGPDGTPAGGALVRLDAMAGNRMQRGGGMNDPYTVADPNGEYTLDNVEPGEKTLVFSRSGLISTSKTVTLSGDHQQVDAQLTSGVSSAGIVVNEGGTPVADAQVRAESPANPGFGRSARTDAGGAFSFDGLAPGRYEFVAQKNGYADAIVRDVDITTGATVRLTLKSGGTIVGHLTGLADADLQSATVYASSPNGNAAAPVDSSGAYRIEGAPLGTVRLNARTGQMMTSRTAPAKSVQVDAGSTVTVDFDFASDTTVKGRVTRNGEAVAGANVMFNGMGRSGRVMTDGSGRYEMTGLDDGKYGVTVMDPTRGPYSTTYTVHGSDTFDIEMRGSAVRGHVIDTSTGTPIPDAAVNIHRKDASVAGIAYSSTGTDSSGNFSFDSVPAGSYLVTADKNDYAATPTEIAVSENGADGVEIRLTPAPGIKLTLVDARDPNQRPISGWYHAVASDGTEYNDDIRFMGGSTAEPLKIKMPAGACKVTVGATGYASQSFTMNSPGVQTVGLTPGGTIVVSTTTAGAHGRLLDSTGLIYGRGRGGPTAFPVEVDPLQSTLPNIAPGTYMLQLLDKTNAVLSSTQVTVAEGQTATVKL
jgi:protocatechuate 3,4-dioxygenase beta subunit